MSNAVGGILDLTELMVVSRAPVELDEAERELLGLRRPMEQTVELVMPAGPDREQLRRTMEGLGFAVENHPHDHATASAALQATKFDPMVVLLLGNVADTEIAELDMRAQELTDSGRETRVRRSLPTVIPHPAEHTTVGGFRAGDRVVFTDPFSSTPSHGVVLGPGGGWDDMVRVRLDSGTRAQIRPTYLAPCR